MRVYTNIPLLSPSLALAKKVLKQRHSIQWCDCYSNLHEINTKYKSMKSLAPTFVREGIAFIFISVSYEFEGHVDHSELYSGNFTYSEELLVLGYTKKLGLFEKKVTIRTNIPSREGADPVGSEWERVFSHLNNIITT